MSRGNGTSAYTSAWIYDGPTPEDWRTGCHVVGAIGGGATTAGRLVLRIGEFEEEFATNGYGYYIGPEVPVDTVFPGTVIEAEAEGHGDLSPFHVSTVFPALVEETRIAGAIPEWPLLELTHSLSEPLTATWAPSGDDHGAMFVIDDLSLGVTCYGRDADGALSIPPEYLQVFSPGDVAFAHMRRCSDTRVGVANLSDVYLSGCNRPRGVQITFE